MSSSKSTDGIVRPQDLHEVVGFSHHTARRTPDFPAPVQLSVRAIGWRRSELLAWLDARPRGYLPTDSTPRKSTVAPARFVPRADVAPVISSKQKPKPTKAPKGATARA
jgi:predicted DNA-binding transcriptional regulator AlpA